MKHIPFTTEYEGQLRTLQSYVLSQSYINYGYSAILLRYIDSPLYLSQNFSFLNISQTYNDTIFSKKPVLLLLSGPSTSKNLDWIKTHREKFIVISALSTCKLLNKIDIAPDIVVHIDPGEGTKKLFEGLDTNYFKNSIAILASNVNLDTVNRFERSQIHFIEQGTKYKYGFGVLSAPSVGEYSYGISLIFGAINIFILGIDLALDQKTFKSHDDFHHGQLKGVINEENASLDPNLSVEHVQGNLVKFVPTTPSYKISIEQFEIFTDILKKEYHTIYNLGDGAYLKGAEPLDLNDWDWDKYNKLDKEQLHQELFNFFNKISESEFNEQDRQQIFYQVKQAKQLEKIIKNHKKKNFTTVEAYLAAISKLSFDLSDMDYGRNSNLGQVYYEYFSTILSYIFDLFNTQELKNPNKHISNIDAILVQQLLKISSLYIEKLSNYLK